MLILLIYNVDVYKFYNVLLYVHEFNYIILYILYNLEVTAANILPQNSYFVLEHINKNASNLKGKNN